MQDNQDPPIPAQQTNFNNIPTIRPPVFNLDTPENIEIAYQHAQHTGFALIWHHNNYEEALAFAKETVSKVWGGIVDDIALRPDLQDRLVAGGFTITDEKSLEKFMGTLSPAFLREVYDILGKNIYLHSGFGAPASNSAFNLNVLWKLRQNPLLDAFAQRFFGTRDVKFSIGRPICKFPGKGEDQFLHKDRKLGLPPDLEKNSGKYCVGESSFICVPESHKWLTQLQENYQELYKDSKSVKWALDRNKEDPLDLFGKTVKVVIPANSMILWFPDLIHGVVRNKTGRIAFGLYVGFLKDVERAEYEKLHKTPEVVDRFCVYSKGVAPKGYPSSDTVQLYPLRFKNFHKRIGDFTDKMDKSDGRYGFARRKLNGRDEYVPHLVAYDPIDYDPPQLSKRGKKLLVGEKRVREFFGDEE
ncbi:hypothetical protein T484DRAFT_1757405 [Baffinella frigidus]|nr:hypothetical protein T484DRAFT_1757405 [Cryptophyta sp. CCMP2293]